LGFFGSSLEASSTFIIETDPKTLGGPGPKCFFCDLTGSNGASGKYTMTPRDAYRQRMYIEPLGLYLQADSGIFASVTLDLPAHTLVVNFAAPANTPAGFQVSRLQVQQSIQIYTYL
jgi:hypothetical protein